MGVDVEGDSDGKGENDRGGRVGHSPVLCGNDVRPSGAGQRGRRLCHGTGIAVRAYTPTRACIETEVHIHIETDTCIYVEIRTHTHARVGT